MYRLQVSMTSPMDSEAQCPLDHLSNVKLNQALFKFNKNK